MENEILEKLPAYKTASVEALPEYAEKPGVIYWVEDNGVPFGIAKSGEDRRLRFYSFMGGGESGGGETDFDRLWNQKGVQTQTQFNGDNVAEAVYDSQSGVLKATRDTVFTAGGATQTERFFGADGVTAEHEKVITTVYGSNGSVSRVVV